MRNPYSRQGTLNFSRTVSFLVTVLALTSLASPPLFAQPDTERDLAEGIHQVEEGDLEAAVVTLDGAARDLATVSGKEKELALAHLYLGMAHLGLSQWERAKKEMREAWRSDRALRLDSSRFPPRVRELYERVRAEEEMAAPSPVAPAAVAPAKGSSSGKGAMIGVGAGVAAAAGVLLATSGGGASAASIPSATPTPTSASYSISGPAGCESPFHVDNVLRVTIAGASLGDFGNVPGNVAGPVDFTAVPGSSGLLQFYDDGGGRILDPLFLCKNKVLVSKLTDGVPYSFSKTCCTPPPGDLILSQAFTLP